MKLEKLHEAYTAAQRTGILDKIRELANKIKQLRSQKISPEDKATVEIGIQALEREITELGRSIRDNTYWIKNNPNLSIEPKI